MRETIFRLLTFLAACVAAPAAITQITDTLKTPSGGDFAGSVVISLNAQRAQPLYNSTGVTLTGWTETVVVSSGGAFSVQLEANDAITPAGTSYLVQYIPKNGSRPWTETWIVPTSGSPVKVAALRATIPPSPTVMVQPSQISGSEASPGQALVYNGTRYAPATIGGGTVYTAVATIDVIAVPDGACVLDTTAVTVTGAAFGGRPAIGASYQPPAGVNLHAKVTGPNSMKIEVCNWSGATYDPSSATYYFGVAQ